MDGESTSGHHDRHHHDRRHAPIPLDTGASPLTGALDALKSVRDVADTMQ
jgi:hypothetical protein